MDLCPLFSQLPIKIYDFTKPSDKNQPAVKNFINQHNLFKSIIPPAYRVFQWFLPAAQKSNLRAGIILKIQINFKAGVSCGIYYVMARFSSCRFALSTFPHLYPGLIKLKR